MHSKAKYSALCIHQASGPRAALRSGYGRYSNGSIDERMAAHTVKLIHATRRFERERGESVRDQGRAEEDSE